VKLQLITENHSHFLHFAANWFFSCSEAHYTNSTQQVDCQEVRTTTTRDINNSRVDDEEPDEFLHSVPNAVPYSYTTPNASVRPNREVEPDGTATIYCVFDLETTGFSRDRNFIIEIACNLLDPDGKFLPEAKFASLVRCQGPIPSIITELTGIQMIDVVDKEDFHVVGKDFVCFLSDKIQEWEDENLTICNQFVFVAHNGRRFDVPFLCKHFERFNILEWEKFLEHFDLYLLDTLELSKF
jgi:DNA polymerase III epsilon subunit-like protein